MDLLRWGVVGVGVAGKARTRALRADPRAVPVVGFRGDPAAVDLPAADSVEALLEQVDAVAICTPDALHAGLVRQALEADKHVVVEYPLATRVREALALFELARDRGRVLHVEHIELLTGQARWLRARCAGRRLVEITVRSRSAFRPGLKSAAHGSLARLHRLLDLTGPPQRLGITESGLARCRADLEWKGGLTAELDLRIEPDGKRSTQMVIALEDAEILMLNATVMENGRVVDLPDPGPLFEADQLHASAVILDGAPDYIGEERVLDGLLLADRLAGFT